jgi:hypothetical protein
MTRDYAALLVLSSMLAAGCGGGAPSPTKPPKGASGPKDKDDDSIAALAAAQGGLAALGGAGNRDDGGATGVEVAMGGALRAEEVDRSAPVKLDGVLKEWHARTPASETIAGKTEGLSFGVAVQYDDARLYVAAEVSDPKLARTSAHGDNDDHVSMTIAFPAGRGALKAYEVGFWPGKPGESSGVVRWLSGPSKGQDVAGAKIVESDVKGGFTFEAAVPWASFAEARAVRVGLRAALRYHDADPTGVRGVIGTGQGSVESPASLPPLPTAPEQAVVENLLGPKNLAGTAPKIDVFADLAGDERRERISVFGRFFTICGPGYRGGKQFFWREVAGELIGIETRDVTGRGKDDLVVKRRVLSGTAVHEIVEVWTLAQGDEPTTIFAHQVAIVSNDGKKRVIDSVRVSQKEIEVATEPATNWDASTFNETVASDDRLEGRECPRAICTGTVEPILLPWGNVKSRTFRFEKGTFAKASEVPQAGTASAGAASKSEPAQPLPRDVPTPPVSKGSDLGKQVLEAYLRDANVAPGTKPRFDLEVHVDGDGRPERVLLVGRDVVVLGPGFKGGTGYARLSLTQFADEKDVTELTARDVTGDGAADIVVRGVRHVATPNGEKVDVDGLFVYQVKGGAIARIFAVETGREAGGKRVQGLVQFVPSKSGKSFDVDVRPGVAKGWTEKTYPWPEDKPGGSIEPLLLPWGKVKSLRYTWTGTQYEARP